MKRTKLLMLCLVIVLTVAYYSANSFTIAATAITNPGFEDDFNGWTKVKPTAISASDVHGGAKAAKLSSPNGSCSQVVSNLSPNTVYTLSAWFLGGGKIGVRNYGSSEVFVSQTTTVWTQVSVTFKTGPVSKSAEIYATWTEGKDFRVDDFTLVEDPKATLTPTQATPVAVSTPAATPAPTPIPVLSSEKADDNLALNKPVKCSSEQVNNEAIHINDGLITNRWSASPYPQWVRIDLGSISEICRTEIVPVSGRAYQYKIEVSTDDVKYTQVVDKTANTLSDSVLNDTFAKTKARYVRLTVTGCANYTGGWASIAEFRVFNNNLVVASPTPSGTPVNISLPAPNNAAVYPSDILDLTNWKITLPLDNDKNGTADEIKQPDFKTFMLDPYFKINSTKNGVIFRAHCGATTTVNSGYPRSELREMINNGTANADWSTTSGTHTMIIKEAITHLPLVKPHTVAGQIHDATDDVIEIRLEEHQLFVQSNGTFEGNLDTSYNLGTVFQLKVVASGGRIKVYYNNMDTPKVDFAKNDSGCYFKAGCYTQSNTSKGDAPDAYGEVVIYELSVSHQ